MLQTYSYWLWINQTINIVAVAILKFSICAYLLVLDFSKVYRWIVWFSIVVITGINFLAPIFTLFGCVPIEANWNRALTNKKCWAVGNLPLSYAQGIVNILTDVVYVVAPISKQTRITSCRYWHCANSPAFVAYKQCLNYSSIDVSIPISSPSKFNGLIRCTRYLSLPLQSAVTEADAMGLAGSLPPQCYVSLCQ